MFFGILCVTLLSHLGMVTANTPPSLAYCKPYKVPVATDPGHHNFRPFFVEMNRCLGACSNTASPHRCSCVATKTTNVTIKLYDFINGKTITLHDEVKCGNKCLAKHKKQCEEGKHSWIENKCQCSCLTPPKGCKTNQNWDPKNCQCVCKKQPGSCSKGMIWNKKSCECECAFAAFTKCSKQRKLTNLKTCRCESSPPVVSQLGSEQTNTSETNLIAALVVVAVLLGLLLITEVYLMCNKKGIICGIVSKCKEPDETAFTQTGENAESGSINMNADNNLSDYKTNDSDNQQIFVQNRHPETRL